MVRATMSRLHSNTLCWFLGSDAVSWKNACSIEEIPMLKVCIAPLVKADFSILGLQIVCEKFFVELLIIGYMDKVRGLYTEDCEAIGP
jgi:hypothetical protein